MKHEWRKKEKGLYLPKTQPEFVQLPSLHFVTISGQGNPNGEPFSSCVQLLFALSYAIKMNLKKETKADGYVDYTVYPLEGVWDLTEEGRKTFDRSLNKDEFVFQLMIRQPDFVSEEYILDMLARTKKKKPHPLWKEVTYETIAEGPCVQMLHIGSFDEEPASFQLMEAFAKEQQLVRKSKVHREIYLSDFRKVPPEKLKTVLRFQVEKGST